MVSMEDRRLNFTQPILSVRRGSSTTTSVPEVNKSKINTNAASNVPPLPYYKSDLKSGPVRNPGVVPFQWEQSPGRPKHETSQSQQTRAIDQPGVATEVPHGRVLNHCSKRSDKSSKCSRVSKPQLEYDSAIISDFSSLLKNTPPQSEKPEDDREENDGSSGDENLSYQNALDSLLRSDSFLNCSLSGLSGLDGSATRLSGFDSNSQARDFMMDRFLPAAKAVASDTAQLGSRKQYQPVCKEEPAVEFKEIITKNQGNPGNHFIPESLAYPHAENGVEEEEDDDDIEEDELDGIDFSSTKLCGLLPRFCLLNPLPGGMRYPTATPVSPVHKVHKKTTNVGAPMKNEAKAIIDAVHERKRPTVYQRSDMRVSNGSNTLDSDLKRLPFRVDPSEPHGDKDGNNIAPYRSSSRHSLMQKERGLLGVPEVPRNSWPVKGKSNQRNARLRQLMVPDQNQNIRDEQLSLTDHSAVKTLYIDSQQGGTEYQDSYSSSSESRSYTDSRGRNPSIDYSLLQDINDLYSVDDKTILQLRSTALVKSSAQHELETTSAVEMEKLMRDKVEPVSSTGLNRKDGHLAGGVIQQSKKEELTIQDKNLLLPLPLPKSPSESWLCRARVLPSVSSRTTNLKAFLGVGNQCSSASPVHPKWENAVSMLTPISEN